MIDKLYKFALGAFADHDANNTLLQIANSTVNPLRHAIELSNVSGFQPGSFDFDYSVSVVGAPSLFIADWFSSAEPNDPSDSSYILTTDTDLTSSQAITFPSSSISPLTPFPGQPTSVNFTNRLVVSPGDLGPNGFTNTITQAPIPPDQVPGPLPLLGAATAFGFSRKLRARIKALA